MYILGVILPKCIYLGWTPWDEPFWMSPRFTSWRFRGADRRRALIGRLTSQSPPLWPMTAQAQSLEGRASWSWSNQICVRWAACGCRRCRTTPCWPSLRSTQRSYLTQVGGGGGTRSLLKKKHFRNIYCCGLCIGKTGHVYLYSTFQHKAIQSALQKWKTLRKWHLKTVIKKQRY